MVLAVGVFTVLVAQGTRREGFGGGAPLRCGNSAAGVEVSLAHGNPFVVFGPALPGGRIQGRPPSLFVGGAWRSADGGLILHNASKIPAQKDALGPFDAITLVYTLSTHKLGGYAAAEPIWATTFKCYTASEQVHGGMQVVFEQSFPAGLHESVGGSLRDLDLPRSAFPAFDTSAWNDFRLVTFFGQNAAQSTRSGPWPTAYRGGYLGGPVALYETADVPVGNVVVLSPLTKFAITEHALVKENELRFGLQGLLYSVPVGFTVQFILSASGLREDITAHYAGRMATAFMRWGDALLRHAGSVRTPTAASPWISMLGYSTTGAYHYNPCDCPGNRNGARCFSGNSTQAPGCHTYQDTLELIDQDAQTRGIPYRWWLVDSWWHAYNQTGAPQSPTLYFEDTPAQVGYIFPDSLHVLFNQTQHLFGAHWSSQFAADSPYSTIDPAHWECAGKDDRHYIRQCVPTSPNVWRHIFGADQSRWGLRVIKIDHVLNLLVGDQAGSPDCDHSDGSPCGAGERNRSLAPNALVQALASVDVAQDFIDGVGTAASEAGVDIMWCMSFPSIIMHSVEHASMTHARGSDDSHPHNTTDNFPQNNWVGFGGESTFLWAVGLWPFKDTFYSNSSARLENWLAEDGGTSGEPMPFTHALVAALSGGGVAPGGPIGTADSTLLGMTCRADGVLLKPTIPAMYVDQVWAGLLDKAEVSTASSVLPGARDSWKFVSIIHNDELRVTTTDIGLADAPAAAYLFCSVRPLSRPCQTSFPEVHIINGSTSFYIPSSNWTEPDGAEAQLLVVAPLFENGMALLGEADKLVPVSPVRFEYLDLTPHQTVRGEERVLRVNARGVAGEDLVTLFAVCPTTTPCTSPTVVRCECKIDTQGRASVSVDGDGRCACG